MSPAQRNAALRYRGACSRRDPDSSEQQEGIVMQRFVVERDMPGASRLPDDTLHALVRRARRCAEQQRERLEWLQSFVSEDKVYCVYRAHDLATLIAHAAQSGWPVSRVSRLHDVLDANRV
jgi:hypothetical protein